VLTDATSGELMFLNELEIRKAYTFYLLKLYVLIFFEFKSMGLASLYITLLPEYQDKKRYNQAGEARQKSHIKLS